MIVLAEIMEVYDWCKDNRLHASKMQQEVADAKLAEYEEGGSG